jgi:hypothetical protein
MTQFDGGKKGPFALMEKLNFDRAQESKWVSVRVQAPGGHQPISLREISLREVLLLESRLLQPIWKCWILGF